MGSPHGPVQHDHRIIYYSIAAIVSVLAGATIGLLSYAGGMNAPLAIVAGLTACGASIYGLAQFITRSDS